MHSRVVVRSSTGCERKKNKFLHDICMNPLHIVRAAKIRSLCVFVTHIFCALAPCSDAATCLAGSCLYEPGALFLPRCPSIYLSYWVEAKEQ